MDVQIPREVHGCLIFLISFEILTPKRDPVASQSRLQAFGERYRRILESNGISIPDNPMAGPGWALCADPAWR